MSNDSNCLFGCSHRNPQGNAIKTFLLKKDTDTDIFL